MATKGGVLKCYLSEVFHQIQEAGAIREQLEQAVLSVGVMMMCKSTSALRKGSCFAEGYVQI